MPTKRASDPARVYTGESPALRPYKTFRDPVQGDVHLTKAETLVVDLPEMQRLGRIRQLGTAYLLYRGAMHTRLDHALGTLSVAERMITAINRNPEPGEKVNDEARVVIRLAALLHDIPHVPFGHTLEDEIGLYRRHDDPDRFDALLGAQTVVGKVIEEELGGPVRGLVLQTLKAKGEKAIKALAYPFASDIVGNTLCADLVDYLRRDAYFTGLPEAFAERLFDYLFVPTNGEHARRLVLRLNKLRRREIRRDLMSDVIGLLRLRYRLAERVYYHPNKQCTSAMIGRAVLESPFLADRDALYSHSDDSLLLSLAGRWHAQESPDRSQAQDSDRPQQVAGAQLFGDQQPAAPEPIPAETPTSPVSLAYKADDRPRSALAADALLNRHLYKRVFLFTYREDFGPFDRFQRELTSLRSPGEYAKLVQRVEDYLGLIPGMVAFYCPEPKMQLKVAEALVTWGDAIYLLENVPHEAYKAEIKAIQDHHRRLWRFSIFVHSSLPNNLRDRVVALFQSFWEEEHNDAIPNEAPGYETAATRAGSPDPLNWYLDGLMHRFDLQHAEAVLTAEERQLVREGRFRGSVSWTQERPTYAQVLQAITAIRAQRQASVGDSIG